MGEEESGRKKAGHKDKKGKKEDKEDEKDNSPKAHKSSRRKEERDTEKKEKRGESKSHSPRSKKDKKEKGDDEEKAERSRARSDSRQKREGKRDRKASKATGDKPSPSSPSSARPQPVEFRGPPEERDPPETNDNKEDESAAADVTPRSMDATPSTKDTTSPRSKHWAKAAATLGSSSKDPKRKGSKEDLTPAQGGIGGDAGEKVEETAFAPQASQNSTTTPLRKSKHWTMAQNLLKRENRNKVKDTLDEGKSSSSPRAPTAPVPEEKSQKEQQQKQSLARLDYERASPEMKICISARNEDRNGIQVVLQHLRAQGENLALKSAAALFYYLKRQGDLEDSPLLDSAVKLIIGAKADVTASDTSRNSPLLIAASEPQSRELLGIVNTLIDAKSDVNYRNKKTDQTPLSAAITSMVTENDCKIVQCLLNADAMPNATNSLGRTVMFDAVAKSSEQLMEELIDHGAHVNHADASKRTPLHIATTKDNVFMCETLIRMRADINRGDDMGRTAVHLAVLNDFPDVLKALVTAKAKINLADGGGETPLAIGTRKKYAGCVSILAAAGGSVTAEDPGSLSPRGTMTPRGGGGEKATRTFQMDTLQPDPSTLFQTEVPHRATLLGPDGEVQNDETKLAALAEAVKVGDVVMVKRAVELKVDVNQIVDKSTQSRVIHFACMDQKRRGIQTVANAIQVVEVLCDSGVDVNRSDSLGRTPLLLSTVKGNATMADILIKYNAHVDTTDVLGQSPLRFAAMANYHDILSSLIVSQANVNGRSKDGQTAIMEAARGGYQRVVQTLVISNADVNLANNLGQTALHEIARRGHYRLVATLVSARAEPRIENQAGETALQIAEKQADKKVYNLLRMVPANSAPPISPMVTEMVRATVSSHQTKKAAEVAQAPVAGSRALALKQKLAAPPPKPILKPPTPKKVQLSEAELLRQKMEEKKRQDMMAFKRYKELEMKSKNNAFRR